MSRLVIINADDLGWSVGITDGILKAHREGIVTSATLAANMPDAERAAALVVSQPSLGVGVHLNACQGQPLCPQARALTDGNGTMQSTAIGLISRCILNPRLIKTISAEFEAQIRWALDHGIQPTHLDSHRHVHAYPPLFIGVVRLAKRYGVPFVRWPCEKLPRGGWPLEPRRQLGTARLLRAVCALNVLTGRSLRVTRGTWGIADTGLISKEWLARAAEALPEGITEVMTHPGFSYDLNHQNTRLLDSRQRELHALCESSTRDAFQQHKLRLVHYGNLHSRPD